MRSRLLIAALLLWLCTVGARRPNVVLIISDDQSWMDFGFMGHGAIQTPHLDRLAQESALFPNGYVPTALCRPSLATILTGLYPHQHKICVNDPPPGSDREVMSPLLREVSTIPRLLQKAGYSSFQTGKWWEGHYSNGGFTHGMTKDLSTGNFHGGPGIAIGRETMQPIYDFIKETGDKPYLIWYAPKMPHTPHDPPERLLKKYAIEGRDIALAKYFGMCEWFDETVGELLDYIDRNGHRDDTLVIFVADNGWIQQTGDLHTAPVFVRPNYRRTRGPFAPKSKNSPYDGGVRTPILVRWPSQVRPGRYLDLVSTIDLAPTILSACGLDPPEEIAGENLLEVITGKRPHLQRSAIFGEIYYHAARQGLEPALNLTHRWVRFNDWKLIDPSSSPLELYNVVQDPFEQSNLVTQYPELVKELIQALDNWWDGS
ncbi:sulfatase [Acidobacteria bacterium AH-259-G07]|nr:sulfatase [Acidobacteria bacterium AH-259-G07]